MKSLAGTLAAPFPWFGGKALACETVWAAFGQVDNYVEPFAGSAAMLLGAPSGHELNVREVRLSAGAGFVVVVCGDIMTMPGLPSTPASTRLDLADDGTILGL